ncbi:MAG: FAD-linked oxidase C-terminal domain-containing protein [Desulfobacteraceae bacterium]|jgi:glycolate oxidase
MIPEVALAELKKILRPGNLLTGQADLEEYSGDSTKLKYTADAVAFPSSAEEISGIFQLSNRVYFPVIPRGGGSGKSGGVLPVKGGLVLAMDKFNRILEIDRENLIARVEPFVITEDFQNEVEKLDLFYPPDPASADVSTLGGNVAECAGGLRGLKYGVTGDYILGLTVVLPTGEIIRTGVETMKGVAGYDLTSLIVGSEGTLAVITSITLKLLPKPESKRTMIVFFMELKTATGTVSKIIRGKVIPSVLEFMDKQIIDCIRPNLDIKIPENTEAILLIEVDGDEQAVIKDAEKVKEICISSGASEFRLAQDKDAAEKIWDARRQVSPSLLELTPGKISEDIVVPRNRIPDLVGFLGELSGKYDLPIPSYGHAGDGNIHVNILLDSNNPDEKSKGETAVRELFKKVIELGGTITGEHGIGITKAGYLEMELPGPVIDLMKRIKTAFDPNNVLNPGKIFL